MKNKHYLWRIIALIALIGSFLACEDELFYEICITCEEDPCICEEICDCDKETCSCAEDCDCDCKVNDKITIFEGSWLVPAGEPLRFFIFKEDTATFTMNGENWLKGTFTYTESGVTILFTDYWDNNQWSELSGPTIIRFQYDNFVENDSFNVFWFTEENQWEPGREYPQVEYQGIWEWKNPA